MKKNTMFLVSAFVVTAFVSCHKDNAEQIATAPDQEVLNLCISNMADFVGQLQAIGTDIKSGTRGEFESAGNAVFVVDQLVCETEIYLKEIGWTIEDFNEMDEVVGIEDAYAWFAALLVAESGGFTDGIPLTGNDITRALSWGEVGACALAVIGVNVGSVLHTAGALTKVALKAAIKTVAKQLLGPVGVAIAVSEFAFCIAAAALTD